MIDNNLLKELVTFSQEKTLAKTAAKLQVTQPTITRGMQKLEDELGVKLFNRQSNRISLTATGNLAVQEANKVLTANQQFINRVQAFATSHQVTKVATTAPGPQIIIRNLQEESKRTINLTTKFINTADVEENLLINHYSLVITNHEFQTSQIESLFIGQEQLYVNLDQFMYLANSKQVNFADLRGLSFVVLDDIGPWKKIIQQQIPEAKFLYQDQWEAITEITKYANFPFFTTNITRANPLQHYSSSDRVQLPITDTAAKMTFYAAYLKANKSQLTPFIQQLTRAWPQLS